MKVFDVIVVGSGSGMMIAEAALNNGMNVALVEMDKLGGTCLNRGCIPTKMILYPADIINQIKHAELLGIKAKIVEIDFAGIMKRTREFVEHDRLPMEKSIKNISGLTFYPFQGEFISDYTMKVGEETIKGTHIFLVSGARPLIPSIEGIDGINYITNKTVWEMTEAPESMIIIGGGLIAVEMAHFFSSMNVEVTVISRSPRLIKMVEPEVSNILLFAMQKRMRIDLNTEVKQVTKNGDQIEAIAYSKDGKRKKYTANSLYIATGRRSNADLLKVEKTGIKVDDRGFISVNKNYETSKKGIYAFGDAIGKEMYKHVANKEANVVWHGFREGHFHPLNYDKTPFAVFTWPQVAVVGLTEEESIKRGFKILVGEYKYANTAKGAAMMEDDGYVKVIVEDETYKILGANIVGPYAPILIQEIINVMYSGEGLIYPIVDAMHIHPALSEVVQRAFFNLHQPGHTHN
jgi:dihydrolipoamide dehydrogenase